MRLRAAARALDLVALALAVATIPPRAALYDEPYSVGDTPVWLLVVDYASDALWWALVLGVNRRPLEALPLLPLDLVFGSATWRLLRLLRLPLVAVERGFLKPDSALKRALYLFLTMGVATHLAGCAFFALGLSESRAGHGSWIEEDGLLDAPPRERALRSFYWAVITMVTVGFGDITPQTNKETAFNLAAMYVGLAVSCTAVANLTILIAGLDASTAEYTAKMDAVAKYVRWRQLPRHLEMQIVAFHEFRRVNTTAVEEERLLSFLPTPLRNHLNESRIERFVVSVKAFHNVNAAFKAGLPKELQLCVFSPQHLVAVQGRVLAGLYYLRGGTAMIFADHAPRAINRLAVGDSFGEEALFAPPALSPATVQAQTFCEFWLLNRQGYQRLAERTCSGAEVAAMTRVGLSSGADKFFSGHVERVVSRRSPSWRRYFLENTRFRWAWSLVCFLGLTYNAIFVPLEVAAVIENADSYDNFHSRVQVKMAFNYLFDVFFLFDLIFSLFLFSYRRDGFEVTSASEISHRYVHSRRFLFDLVAVLPLDLLALASGVGGGAAIPFLRANKTFRLIHLPEYLQLVQTMAFSKKRGVSPVVLRRLATVVFALGLTVHWAGLVWVIVGRVTRREGEDNWIDTDHESPEKDLGDGLGVEYLRAVYWVVVGASTVGYGDIVPVNESETAVAAVAMWFGGLAKPAVVGSLAALILALNTESDGFQQTVTNLKAYMERRGFPPALRERVSRFHHFLWHRTNDKTELSFLRELPAPLRAEVADHIVGGILGQLPIFSDVPEQVRALLPMIEPRLFSPDDLMLAAGDFANNMYLVVSGVVVEVGPDMVTVTRAIEATSPPRERYVGLQCLLPGERYFFSAISRTFSEAFIIRRAHITVAFADNPEALQRVEAAAARLLEDKKTSITESLANMEELMSATQTGRLFNFHDMPVLRRLSSSTAVTVAPSDLHPLQHPQSEVRYAWDAVVCAVVVFNIVAVSLRLAFPSSIATLAVDWLLDCFLLLDIYLRLNFLAYLDKGRLQPQKASIRSRYIRSGRCLVDVTASIPYDLLLLWGGVDWIAYVRIPKLLRVVNLHFYYTRMNAAAHDLLAEHIKTVRVLSLLATVLVMSHITACAFYAHAVTARGDSGSWDGTWVGLQIDWQLLPRDGGDSWQRYLRALNWSLPTLVVAVIGDVVPVTASETALCLAVILLGASVNASVIGTLADLIGEVGTPKARFGARVEAVERWMALHSTVPGSLKERVRDYEEYLWERTQGVDDDVVASSIPASLRQRMATFLLSSTLNKCAVLGKFDRALLSQIAQRMRRARFEPGDIVLAEGLRPREAVFCEKGVALLVVNGELTSTDAVSFGVEEMMSHMPMKYSVCVGDYCNVFVLPRRALVAVLTKHPSPRGKKLLAMALSSHSSGSNTSLRSLGDSRGSLQSAESSDSLIDGLSPHSSGSDASLLSLGDSRGSLQSAESSDSLIDADDGTGTPLRSLDSLEEESEDLRSLLASEEEKAEEEKTGEEEEKTGEEEEKAEGKAEEEEAEETNAEQEEEKTEDETKAGEEQEVQEAAKPKLQRRSPRSGPSSDFGAPANGDSDGVELQLDEPDAGPVQLQRRIVSTFLSLSRGYSSEGSGKTKAQATLATPRRRRSTTFGMRAAHRISSVQVSHRSTRQAMPMRDVWRWRLSYPFSPFRVAFDCTRLFLAVYLIWFVTFRAAVLVEDRVGDLWLWYLLDYVAEAFFLADLWLRCYKFGYAKEGRVETDPAAIFERYREHGMLIDVVACLPVDIFAAGSGMGVLRVLRVWRVLRLASLPRYLRAVRRHASHLGVSPSNSVQTIGVVVSCSMLLNHLLACAFLFVHRYAERHEARTWATVDGISTWDAETGEHNVCNDSLGGECYLRAVYFVWGTLSTTGFGDIRPQQPAETVLQLATAISGACVFACLTGAMVSFLHYVDTDGENGFQVKQKSLRRYCALRGVGEGLQATLEEHQRLMWDSERLLDERQVMALLPLRLRMEVAAYAKESILSSIPFFRELSPFILSRLALALRRRFCLDMQFVFHFRDAASPELYLLDNGKVRESWRSATDGRLFETTLHTAGAHFGWVRTGDRAAVSEGTSELYALSADDLEDVVQRMPEADRLKFDAWMNEPPRGAVEVSETSTIDRSMRPGKDHLQVQIQGLKLRRLHTSAFSESTDEPGTPPGLSSSDGSAKVIELRRTTSVV